MMRKTASFISHRVQVLFLYETQSIVRLYLRHVSLGIIKLKKRVRDGVDCCFHLYSATQPCIESSTHVQIYPFDYTYHALAGTIHSLMIEQFKIAGLDPMHKEEWTEIFDFTPNSTIPNYIMNEVSFYLIVRKDQKKVINGQMMLRVVQWG